MVNIDLLKHRYQGNKVIIKKKYGINPEYGIFEDADEHYIYLSKALPKPTDTNGFSAELDEELKKMDKLESIDKLGFRLVTINHDDVRNIEKLVSQEEKEKIVRRLLSLPDDPEQ